MPVSLDDAYARALARWTPAKPTYDAEVVPTWVEDGKVVTFHDHQLLAWQSTSGVVAICAGWQSGKTVFLVWWLLREIQRCGPGDYGAFSSTYKLLARKLLPELKKVFGKFAEFKGADNQFVFTAAGEIALFGKRQDSQTVIQLGYAENPDSLESATLKAVIWDECGQRLVPEQSYRTVESRLMVYQGRMCLASRPYEFNWYEKLVRLADGVKSQVISFASWANPANPPEGDEYWTAKRNSMPEWMFTMLYGGRFTRPAGAIYDCFDESIHVVDDFEIPEHWEIFVGQDFGERNMAAVFVAVDPADGTGYVFASYHKGGISLREHIQRMRAKAGRTPNAIAGGAPSEDEWRDNFTRFGWTVLRPPVKSVEVGIAKVYRLLVEGKLKFFRVGAAAVIDEVNRYTREVGDDGELTDKIADKETFHRLDSLRYCATTLLGLAGVGAGVKFRKLKFTHV